MPRNTLHFFLALFVGFFLFGCSSESGTEENSEPQKELIQNGYLSDSRIAGIGYSYNGTFRGYTDANGSFEYDANLNPQIEFTIGNIVLGTIDTRSIEADATFYPAHLVNVDLNESNNTQVTKILQLVQSLDSDNNPYNGITISNTIFEKLSSLDKIDFANDDINDSMLEQIVVNEANKTLIPKEYAIAHYEDTLRKELGLNVDTVPPAPALYATKPNPTNDNNTSISINGEVGAKIFVDSVYTGIKIDNNNLATVYLDTTGPDGNYDFNITLQDDMNKTGDGFIATILKDTVVPSFSISNLSVNENVQNLIDVNATDDLEIVYSISGADSSHFTVDSSSGIITFKNATDYETKTTYNLSISATDEATNVSTQNITITVNHQNDEKPILTSGAEYAVEENNATIGTLTYSDADIDETNQVFTFQLSGGDDLDKFQLNGSQLSFVDAPDFDNPTDTGNNNSYLVDVTVSDGLNQTTKTITVHVTPANDNAPVIISDSTVTFTENATDLVLDLDHTDADSVKPGMVQIFTYSLSGTDASSFVIDSTNGQIRFVSTPDYENQTSYSITVNLFDGKNYAIPKDITVNINHLNDETPIISTQNLTVDENTTAVTTIQYTDRDIDENQTFIYSVTGTDASSFNINQDSGVLTFKSIPDYETKKSYSLTLQVSDGLNVGIKNIVVSIGHLNDEIPVITSSNTSINENNTSIMIVTSSDADQDENQTFTYSIDGGADATLFNLSNDGNLTFKTAPNYEIPTDEDNNSIYVVGVKVFDGVNTSTIKTLSIAVTPVNDIAPVITSTDTSINENETNVMLVTSIDDDLDQNDQIFTYSIDGGADAALFNITNDGNLTFKTAPNYEIPTDSDTNNIYIVGVKVHDGVNTSTIKTLNITVNPINDIAPVLTSSNNEQVDENFNETLLTLTSTDGDMDQNDQVFTYYLGGADKNFFNINAISGVITFKTTPDYESRQTPYTITAKVNDGVNDSIEQNITITVNHVNDEAPLITAVNAQNVNENTPITTVVIDANATDRDILENETLSYTLAGDDVSLFNLDSSTGEITFKEVPDYEDPKDANKDNVFNLTIFATDSAGNVGQASNLTIRLINLDDVPEPTVFSNVVKGTVSGSKIAPNALVILQDSNKNIMQGYTDAYGFYTLNLSSNFVGPFIIKSYLSTGEILYSYNDGTKEVTNVTPITTLMVKNFVINLSTTMENLFTNFKSLYSDNSSNFSTWFNTSYTTVNNYFTTYLTANNLSSFNHVYNRFYSYGFDYDRLLSNLNMYVSGESIIIRDSSNNLYTSTDTTISSSTIDISGTVRDHSGNLVSNATVVVNYDGTDHTVTTNSSGLYTLLVPRYVDFDLTISYSGNTINYYGLSSYVDLNDTTTSSIAIEEVQFVDTSDTSDKTITGTIVNTSNTQLAVDDAIVKVRSGYNNHTGSVVKTTTTNSSGDFSVSLKNGNYTFEYSKENYTTKYISVYVNGAKTLSTESIQLISDVAGISSVNVSLDTNSDTGSSDSDNYTNDTTPTIVTDQNAYLLLKNDLFQTIQEINVTSIDNKFTLNTLAEGNYAIVGTDSQGNATGFNLLAFTIDTTLAKPTINLHSSSDTGASSTDNITRDSSPRFDGLTEAGATLSIRNGSSEIATDNTDSAGNYSKIIYGLVDGDYNLTVVASDKAGNIAISDNLNVTIDTVGAPLTTIDMLESSDTGKYNHDAITNDNTPTFTADQNVTIDLRYDSNNSIITSFDVVKDINFTLTTLPDGIYKLTSGDENNNTDTAGNTLNYSYLKFTIDTVAGTPSIDLYSDTGKSSIDNITNDNTPSFTYSKESSSDVVMKANGNEIEWSYSSYLSYITLNTLVDGNHTITMTMTDLAGNSATSSALEIEVDTVGIEAATILVEVDSGKGYDDYRQITNDDTPTIKLNKNQSIRVYSGSTLVQEHNLTATGDGNYSVTLSQLGNATYKIESGINDTDIAGNSLGYSYINLEIDTTIVIATVRLNSSSDSGISNSDNITNDNTPRLIIQGESYNNGYASYELFKSDANETNVSIHSGNLDYSGYRYLDVSQLDDGNYTFHAIITDTAENNSTSAPLTIQIDTVGEDKYTIDLNNSINLNNIPNAHTLNYNDLETYRWIDAGDDMYDYGNRLYIDDTQQYIWTKENSSGTKSWGNYNFNTYKSATSLVIPDFNATKIKIYDDTDPNNDTKFGLLREVNGMKIYYHQILTSYDASINHIFITNATNPTVYEYHNYDDYNFELSNIEKGSYVQYILIAGKDGYQYSEYELLQMIGFTNDTTPSFIIDRNTSLELYDSNNTSIQTINTVFNDVNHTATTNQLNDGGYLLTTGNFGTDTAGNNLSYTSSLFFVDTNISTPTIDLNTSSDTGSSNDDNITNDNTPTIVGTAEAGSKVIIVDDSNNTLGTTSADSNNSYAVVLSELTDGNYTIKAIATDAAQNTATSQTIEIEIDTVGDTTISLDLNSVSDTGTSTSDNITSDTTPTIDTDRFSTIWVKDINNSLVQEINTTNNSITLSTLSDGNYTIFGGVDANDTAGNYLSYGNISIQIDTTLPTFTSPTQLDNNSTITASSLHVYNTATSDASNVTYELSGTDASKFTIDSVTGIISLNNIDDAGSSYTVQVTATDSAGNANIQNITITPQIITPLESAKLTAQNGKSSDNLGQDIAISGDYIVVGTSGNGAYVYKKLSNGSVKELTYLTGSDYENIGYTVDISGDYIIVGSQYNDAAYLYKIYSDNNISQIQKLTITSPNYFGSNVAIDGNYIVVADKDLYTDYYSQGAAFVFKINSDNNVSQIAKLVASDAESYDYFGYSIDISGEHIIVGAYGEDEKGSDAGAAYLFKKYSDSNISQVAKLTSTNSNSYYNFGYSVAISGNNIAIGTEDADKVYVYQIKDTNYIPQIASISVSSYDYFGRSVALDDEYLVIGDHYVYDGISYSNDIGAAYLYKIDNEDGVTQMKKITASDAQDADYFGHAVAIDNGNIVVGANQEDEKANAAGAAYLYNIFANEPYIPMMQSELTYTEDSSYFTYTIPDTVNIDNATLDYNISGADAAQFVLNNGIIQSSSIFDYENPVDSNSDNNYSITLNVSDTSGRLNAYDITISIKDESYLQTAKIKAADAESSDYFASSIATDGDYLVATAPYEDPNGESNAGSAYLMKKQNDGTMKQVYKFAASDASSSLFMGRLMSNVKDNNLIDINGDYIVVGAQYADNSNNSTYDSGAAYVFKKNNDDSVSQIVKLVSDEPESYDKFGNSVAISGDYIAVASVFDDDNGSASGSVYLFKRYNDNNISQIAKLRASDASYDDRFGYSIAMSGNKLIVGAVYDNSSTGAVYVYDINTSNDTVTEQSKVSASNASTYDYFGSNVGIDGNYFVVNAWGVSTSYVYKIDGETITEIGLLDNTGFGGDDQVVTIKGNTVLYSDSYAQNVIVYSIENNDSVVKVKTLEEFDGTTDIYFGTSSGIIGNDIFVGAIQEDTTTYDSGAIYHFTKDPNQP